MKIMNQPNSTKRWMVMIGVLIVVVLACPVVVGELWYTVRVLCPRGFRHAMFGPLAHGKDDDRMPSITLVKVHSMLQFFATAQALPTNQCQYDHFEMGLFSSSPVRANPETQLRRTYEYDSTTGVYAVWVRPLPELPRLYITSTNTRPAYAFTNEAHVAGCVSALVARIKGVSRYSPVRYWQIRLPMACLVEIAPHHATVQLLEQIADDPFEMWPVRRLAIEMRLLAAMRSMDYNAQPVGHADSEMSHEVMRQAECVGTNTADRINKTSE